MAKKFNYQILSKVLLIECSCKRIITIPRALIKKAYEETLPIQIRIYKNVDGEYRMNLLGGAEDTAYYTEELDDAFGTAILDYGEDIEVQGPKHIKKAFLAYQKNRRDSQS